MSDEAAVCQTCKRILEMTPEHFDEIGWPIDTGIFYVGKCRFCRENPQYEDRASGLKYRADGDITGHKLFLMLEQQKRRCAYCQTLIVGMDFHVDHITAVARGGSSDASNLCITCDRCNLRKNAKETFTSAPTLSDVEAIGQYLSRKRATSEGKKDRLFEDYCDGRLSIEEFRAQKERLEAEFAAEEQMAAELRGELGL